MALDTQFLEPMIHEIVVEHCSTSGPDGYGKRTFTSASTFQARIEFTKQIVKDAQQKDVISKTRIFTPQYDVDGSTAAVIGISDRITLPAQFVPRTPPIISVEPHYDHEGPHHFEVYV
jgi:hypothetical protein